MSPIHISSYSCCHRDRISRYSRLTVLAAAVPSVIRTLIYDWIAYLRCGATSSRYCAVLAMLEFFFLLHTAMFEFMRISNWMLAPGRRHSFIREWLCVVVPNSNPFSCGQARWLYHCAKFLEPCLPRMYVSSIEPCQRSEHVFSHRPVMTRRCHVLFFAQTKFVCFRQAPCIYSDRAATVHSP
jgi:hypothetical protein